MVGRKQVGDVLLLVLPFAMEDAEDELPITVASGYHEHRFVPNNLIYVSRFCARTITALQGVGVEH